MPNLPKEHEGARICSAHAQEDGMFNPMWNPQRLVDIATQCHEMIPKVEAWPA